MYPTVGMFCKGTISLNFGNEPFKFQLSDMFNFDKKGGKRKGKDSLYVLNIPVKKKKKTKKKRRRKNIKLNKIKF